MEKVFAGSGKIVKTKYGEMTKISFSQKDLDTLQANISNGWINLILKEKKEKVEGKSTHYLEVDFYKAEAKANAPTKAEFADATNGQPNSDTGVPTADDLPF